MAKLAEAPANFRALLDQRPETESFKFGNGGMLPSAVRWRIPAMIGDHLVCIWVSAFPVQSLGLLLGRDALDGLGGVLDLGGEALAAASSMTWPCLWSDLVQGTWP